MLPGLDRALAIAMGGAFGCAAGFAMLIEGSALTAAKIIAKHEAKWAKITKVGLAALAVAAALIVSVGLGASATVAVALCYPFNTATPLISGAITGAFTLLFHKEAFKRAGF